MAILANFIRPTRKPDPVSYERDKAQKLADVQKLLASIAEQGPIGPAGGGDDRSAGRTFAQLR